MKVSDEMKEVMMKTHKFTTTSWTSVFDITYIGYGHRVETGEVFEKKLTKLKASHLLDSDMERIEKQVSNLFDNKEIPQQHFDVFCHIVYDYSYKGFKISRLYLMYKEALIKGIELKCSMIPYIMIWSKIKGHYSKAMAYRRQTDIKIYTSLDYRTE